METLIPRFPMPSLLRQLPAFALASLLTSWAAPATTDAGRANPFFAFDNGVGRGDGWSPEKQAVTLARLGYAGIGYTGLDDLATRQAAFQTASLRIFSVYVAADVAKTPAFDPRLPESFPQLAATGTDVWLTLPGKSSNDERAVAIVRELAEAAARHGVRIVLYPHTGFFVATAEDALRVVRQVNRPNVGLTFNLAHELAAGHAGRLALIIKAIAPHLMLVSVNGADPSGGWEQFIRPLDEGSLDVAAVLRHLDAAGYRGPMGLQCYNIKGEPDTLLLRSIAAWRKLPDTTAAPPPAATPSFATLLDAAQADESLAGARQSLIAAARKAAAEPIIRRCYTLEEIGKNRTFYDGRADALDGENKFLFASAMADFGAAGTVAAELPLIAAAARLTGDGSFKRRVLAQLEEMSTWSPLQRTGWTRSSPGKRLPKDGKDGSWLATGTGVRAIADTLEILAPEDVPPELRARLESLLRAEIAEVMEDWRLRRQWFVKSNNPITNQWVLPNEGLVRACVLLGRQNFPNEYELGVTNLLRSLDAQGTDGEFKEGLHYAMFTVTSLMAAARATARDGDRRLIDHPFLQRFPRWVIHHLQPARKIINAFDCFSNSAPRHEGAMLDMLAACGSHLASREAVWAMRHLFDGPPDKLEGLFSRAMPVATQEPPLFAAYERATRVNWRDHWDDGGSGVWIRGGHTDDQHDHKDRGHVNFIHQGRCILIEAGTPAYHNPRMLSHYASGLGHNVLQIGDAAPPTNSTQTPPGWQKAKAVAPIQVQRLDATGGEVSVDATAGYDDLERWRRAVKWTTDTVEVRDDVALAGAKTGQILFRWHLGTRHPVEVSGQDGKWQVSWPDATMAIESATALEVTQEQLPDHTLEERTWEETGKDWLHACVIVRTTTPATSAGIVTRVVARSPATNAESTPKTGSNP